MRLLLPLLLAGVSLAGPATTRSTVRMAEGTRWETPAFVQTASAPGPVVMIVGGMHGNETAGWRAAEQIRHWTITRGTLIVLPRANTLGCDQLARKVPAEEPYNLNRQFPSKKGAEISGPLATAIWKLARESKPDWLVDLHESVDFYGTKKYLGNSLICASDERTRKTAKTLAATLTLWNPRPVGRWVVLKEPIEGSLVRAAAGRLGAHAFIAETCRKDYLAIRIRHHRVLVHRLLRELKMLPDGFSPHTFFPARREPGEIRVAIFNTYGTGSSSASDVERCLPPLGRVSSRRITATAIGSGALDQFDVVVFPGGMATGSTRSLGMSGREAVRKFVREGGGYIGVCAGAYLATSHYSWSLHILDSKVLDTQHWARGSGTVEMELTRAGHDLFGLPNGTVKIHYAQGPILAPGGKPKIPDFETLALYRTEIAKNGAPGGVMIGTPAIVRSRYGEGRVFVSSPHPESSKGLAEIIRRAVIWTAR
jgi:glutamine amidotransferase-like uncharacterized protein